MRWACDRWDSSQHAKVQINPSAVRSADPVAVRVAPVVRVGVKMGGRVQNSRASMVRQTGMAAVAVGPVVVGVVLEGSVPW